jgi:hypothetical protein
MGEKPKRPWTVLPHSTIQKLEDNLWCVENNVPGTSIGRRMCIIKRTDGSLLFFHAIPLDEAALAKVMELGTPKYLVLGHDQHTVDAHAFAEKLGVKVYGPKKSEVGLQKKVTLEGILEDIPPDPSLDISSVPGTTHGETAILVRSGPEERVNILISDVIQNNPPEKIAFVFRLLGFGGGPKVVPAFRMLFLKDRTAVKETFLKWAAIPNLKRIIVFHGTIVDNDAAGALKSVAATL